MPDEIDEINPNDLNLDGGDEIPPGQQDEIDPTKSKAAADPNAELRTIMSDLATHVKTVTAPKAQEPEMTEEQKAEYWGVYNPEADDKEFFKKFFRLTEDMKPEDVQAMKQLFGGFQKGIVKQAIVGAMRMVQNILKERDEKNAPLHEYVSQERARGLRTRFNETYPILADKKYNKVVAYVSNELKGQNFPDEEAFFKALAEGAAEHIKTIDESFELGQQTKPNKTGTPPRLPRGGAGGGGGAGGNGENGAPTKRRNFASDVLD